MVHQWFEELPPSCPPSMSKKMLELKIDTIYEYYAHPQLLTVRDCFDTLYLCLLYADEPECRYTAIKVSSERLMKFCRGKVDLRTLFLKPEGGKAYYEVCCQADSYLLSSEVSTSISEERLPADGYYLDEMDKESYMVNIPVRDHGIFKEIVKTFGWACM